MVLLMRRKTFQYLENGHITHPGAFGTDMQKVDWQKSRQSEWWRPPPAETCFKTAQVSALAASDRNKTRLARGRVGTPMFIFGLPGPINVFLV